MRLKSKQAVTLIEILVSCSVFSVLLTVIFAVLVPALRSWSDGQKRSELGQSALLTSNWIRDDVLRCAPKSLQNNEEGILVMTCALGQREDHTNPFTEAVGYSRVGSRLFRAHKTLSEEKEGPPLVSLAEFSSMQSYRRIASDLEHFEVRIIEPWRAELTLRLNKEGRKTEIKTSFSSIYAPLDPNLAQREALTPPSP